MKVTINEECIGCGLCEGTADGIFAISDEGVAEIIVDEISEDDEDAVQEAADSCPVGAIEVE